MPDEWESKKPLTPNQTPSGLTVSGTYTGIGATHYTVEIDGSGCLSGAYTFRWSVGGLKAFEDAAILITADALTKQYW